MNELKLNVLIESLKKNELLVDSNIAKDGAASFVTYDSRIVVDNTLFICKGANFKRDYLVQAIEKGATCYISETEYDGINTPFIIVNDIRKAICVIAQCYYGDLSSKIKVVGITGTKGKSTITYFTKSILDEYLTEAKGTKTAFCSGIRNYDGVIDEESQLTTPELLDVYQHMNNAIDSGIDYMVMEVSSQGLKYDRVDGINYEVACFNNIGDDHISPNEHPDFEDYFSSKLKIFSQCKKACINMDSDHFERIMSAASALPVVTYGFNDKSNIYCSEYYANNGKVKFDVVGRSIDGCEDFDENFELSTFGTINVINALAAIAISVSLGIPMKYIKSGLGKASIPGRMQVFRSSDERCVGIADYAHNELSFDALLSSVKNEFPDRDIIIVFGSAGGKAVNRRAGMGKMAAKYCKHIVLTEDDPGPEDTLDICNEIAEYIDGKCSYEVIQDRPEAVRKAISYADENTIIIAAGKSLENYIKRGNKKCIVPSDVEIMSEEFAKL